MNKIHTTISNWLANPKVLEVFHGWMTIMWLLLIPITLLTGLKGSLLWIALMSVYANFIGHFSSWQGARAEVAVCAQKEVDADE